MPVPRRVRQAGVPVLAIARAGKGRFELAAHLEPDVRRLLAAAGSALLLAEVDGSQEARAARAARAPDASRGRTGSRASSPSSLPY